MADTVRQRLLDDPVDARAVRVGERLQLPVDGQVDPEVAAARDVARRCDLRVDLTVDGELEPLPDAHRTCIYRVVQEALTNCVRHGHASRVAVTLVGRPASLDVRVEDDGVGFAPAARRSGLGLLGLDERVRELRGELIIDSQPGHGTRLHVTMPVPAATPEEAVLAHLAG